MRALSTFIGALLCSAAAFPLFAAKTAASPKIQAAQKSICEGNMARDSVERSKSRDLRVGGESQEDEARVDGRMKAEEDDHDK